ncbi:prion-inhibition and propagation-domain-containing protein [Boeremia exigua]|uniref:prion-inhibition and propagation-domain-containing protein n=1 Tax=Boeremia exigua TaxID=749465 RepID=UPI001E8E35AA|nr:prion-inhibition and propagation-domain-containing protein [Boeremia exigua]KAH6612740.1 prion-inhibition and propagation-domain-containing protein [Boeremia exigua]
MSSKATTERIEGDAQAPTKAQILDKVFSLATQFGTCVEAFNLIHPSKESDHAQKVALAKLGVQQGRLLIFGDAVGISAPPATIARHMIPSHPGLTNPDPHLPVNFGVRDSRLEDDPTYEKVRKALSEIAGRPGHLSRDDLMEKYGLKSPKRFNMLEHPALDTNRMEAFREKYGLLQDLVRQSGARANIKRNMSMTTTHWTVKDTTRFDEFVRAVRIEVDGLINLFGVNEQVDRGMKSDIRSMAWHPELSGPVVQQDWEKLRLIREACEIDYPQYLEVADTALQYINDELKETSLANRRASLGIPAGGAAGARRKSDYEIRAHPEVTQTQKKGSVGAEEKTAIQLAAENVLNPPKPVRRPSNSKKNSYNSQKEKRPGWLSAFKFKSWSKSHKHEKERSNSLPEDPARSLSVPENEVLDISAEDDGFHGLEPVRSKSVGEIPSGPALDLDSRMQELSIDHKESEQQQGPAISVDSPNRATFDQNDLEQIKTVSSDGMQDYVVPATTANSYIDRHDMYQGMGRIETKDIRNIAHEPRGGFE